MRLTDYTNVLRRRWWIVVLTAFVAAASAYAFTRFQERLYRSEATYLVLANQLDNGLSIVLENSMNSYKELALAPRELDQVSQQLGLDRSAEWLLNKHVAIQPLPDQRKMIVQVTYPDPEVAPKLANAIGQNMVGLVASLNASLEGSSRINLRELQPADRVNLYWPQTRVIVAAGGVLGLVLGLLLAFVIEALDNTLKTAADIERFVGLTTLGAIPTVE
ncbi:MAG: Wzz/FepE/Etk N-terminal domain-containing protein [Kouleothrix sp.]|jgi:capsular polysaccharide biosynthesis protein|nr:lipopolysaccharide biosynthesis protein [Kouleothrix sp.]